jgi:transcriptional regulator with XRE-family HTH domain
MIQYVSMAKFSKKTALRAYRKRHRMSADECGAKVGISGITWRSYENGHREVDADMALKIERELGIRPVLVRADIFRRREAA